MAIEHRDVVVIGSGPAGAAAARQAALAGLRPLLVEQHETPGARNACGGLAAYALRQRLDLPEQVVEQDIQRTVLTIDGKRFEYGGKRPHYISFRRVPFDTFLAGRAVHAGAELRTSTRAEILDPAECLVGLTNTLTGTEDVVKAGVIILADGPRTLAADTYHIGHRPGPRTRRAIFVELDGVVGDSETCELIVTTAFTKSYIWLFPKRDCTWVGVGGTLEGPPSPPLKKRLMQFIEERDDLRGRTMRLSGAGLVPSYVPTGLVADGAMVVGDAAGLVNPMTGGGIVFALASGEIAGRVAAESVKAGRTDRKALRKYPRRFRSTPYYVWLRIMGLLRHGLDRKSPDKQPFAYVKMLRRYFSFFHHAHSLVDMTLRRRSVAPGRRRAGHRGQ